MSVDLRTRYLGLELRNPLVAAASPLTSEIGRLRRLEAAGAAAVVLPSLFEEQIEHEDKELHHLAEYGSDSFPEALSYFPEMDAYARGPEDYLHLIEEAKRTLAIPVIASLNGVTSGGWVQYARWSQEAGADALELNIYFVAGDPAVSGPQVEERYLALVRAVRDATSIPIAVKLSPFFSSLPHLGRRLVEAGADGLVLFNRFLQPDVDLEEMQVVPHLELSTSAELLLPLTWIGLLRGRVPVSLAATSGVHTSRDALKLLLAGADAVMMASALLRRGPEHLTTLLDEMGKWLAEKEYASIEQLKGSLSQEHSPDPGAFERANYMKALVRYASSYQV